MKRLSLLLVTLVACAGTQEESIKPIPGLPPPPPKPMASSDVSFELPVIEIKGVVFEPEAIGRPGMPLVDPKKKTTLDKQRALVQSTKDLVQKQAQAAVLATMLYRESKANKANEKAMLGEARQVLRDVAQLAGDKAVDEITLRLLGSYELLLEDYPAAEKAWQELIDRDPKSKEIPYNRAWLAYALLKQWKNAEALAAVATEKLDESQPELAYVTAWAKWRTGDNAGAWQAIVTAARGWGQNANRDELERDVLFFAGRANIVLAEAIGTVTTVLGKTRAQQYELLAKLGLTGFGGAGRWADGIAALDKAVEVAGDTVPPNDRPVIRYSQADFAVRLDMPDVAVTYAKQAIDALSSCGAKCSDKDKADIVQGVYLMGRLFHILYATANDRRYYQPAHDLYALTIPLLSDAATRTQAQKDAGVLETTLKNTKVGTGTHDKGALGALFARHSPEIEACYEAGLAGNPKLGGTITLNLESDASGVIKGISSEPKAGLADLSAVAGCVIEHAKQWKLPKRGMAGTTRIKMSYAFSIKK
ncbi:MAG TPA: AgmX/PglI C-terminal domain-containing protein [Kofleriaceae bacterium]|nr:AgmX/PglI C-terminal domain-containing protein [Kofleriaceae bacterium]